MVVRSVNPSRNISYVTNTFIMVFSFNYIVVNKLLYSSSFVLYIANIINIIKDKSHDCKTCDEMGFFYVHNNILYYKRPIYGI